MEIAIRDEKGKVRWVKLDKVISKFINKKATTLPLSSDKDFDKWYKLYNKKTTKKQNLSRSPGEVPGDPLETTISKDLKLILLEDFGGEGCWIIGHRF